VAQWLFTSNRQGWGASDDVWTDEQGRPLGCVMGSQSISGLSTSVTPDSPCSFWAKIVWDEVIPPESPIDIDVSLTSNGDLVDISATRTISAVPYDSGWFKVFGNAAGTGTVTDLGTNVGASMPDWPGIVYFDSIYVAETEPGGYDLTHSAGGVPGAVMA
jgi:hypothetical protein